MVRRGPGLVRTVGRTAVIAGTASAVGGRVQHRQQEKYAAQDQAQYEQQMAAPQQQAAAPAPAAAPDDMDQLTQLAQLHDQGILTDEEFAAKKAQILGI
ncbi:MAG TPA: SHOCT domain-containing protein [Acidimicrobiia bacterium]